MGEKEIVWKAEDAENKQRLNIFKDVQSQFNIDKGILNSQQMTAYSRETNKLYQQRAQSHAKEMTKINKEWTGVTSSVDKDWTLNFFKEGKIISSFTDYKEWTNGSFVTQTNEDWGYTSIKQNKETGNVLIKDYTSKWKLIRNYWTYWDVAISSWITNNIPDENNNPFNLRGASPLLNKSGIEHSINRGHLKFNTPEDGLKAWIQDLDAKLAWNTTNKHILKGLNDYGYVSIWDLGRAWAEDPTWGIKVSAILGEDITSNVATIDRTLLLKAMARQEWYTGEIEIKWNIESSSNITTQANELIYTQWAKINQFKSEDRAKILEEKNRIIETLPWNAIFYQLKTEDKEGLWKFIDLWTKIDEIAELKKLVDAWKGIWFTNTVTRNIGKFMETTQWLSNFNIEDEEDINFDKLSSYVNEQMASYIKEISGATVSNTERTTLEKVMPSMKDSSESFNNNLEKFRSTWNSSLKVKMWIYWFEDQNVMYTTLIWKDTKWTGNVIEIPESILNGN